ncbi:fatty acid desaturase [Alkalilimnicola ehrlichii]|uniref:Fatty acid desaturase n=1 Tax=Alkalilimnicola ehrlichii TaxID=351052 RepID=A0A3E0WVD2_9GAMM|nr:fatty acid desaturase [Alkalilimnicola ehrlichii]RFA29210.1 fatty acid desaturase [Alkalilimnicola ehrlichii]RFA36121.1 fatty acid desaturase [Alkalilimnicola ehrlichii]
MDRTDLLAAQDEIRLAKRADLKVAKDRNAELLALLKPVPEKFLLALTIHLAVWFACALLIAFTDSILVHIVAVLIMGNQLHTFTVLQHDCGHQSAFRSRTLNKWFGRALAAFIVFPYTAFTECHKRHHRYLGDPEKDPDEWHYTDGVKWLFVRIALFVPRFTYLSMVRYGNKVRNAVLAELAVNLTIAVALFALFIWQGLIYEFVLIFVLPLLLLALVINPISRGYEHYPMATLPSDDEGRLDLAKNTITVTSRLFGLIWANINYHVEHHAYPAVPFCNLPKLARLMADKEFLRDRWVLERAFANSPPAEEDSSLVADTRPADNHVK